MNADPYSWRKPAIEGGQHPCLCCGVIASKFGPDNVIAAGFGAAYLTCNGAQVYDEQDVEGEKYMTGAEAEAMAAYRTAKTRTAIALAVELAPDFLKVMDSTN